MYCSSAFLILPLFFVNSSDSTPLEAQTARFGARFHCGSLVHLRDRNGTVYVRPAGETPGQGIHRIAAEHHATTAAGAGGLNEGGETHRRYATFTDLPDAAAEATYRAGTDGDLVLRQTATSPQPGVWGVSWSIGRIPLDYAVVIPGRSGIRLTSNSPGRKHQFDYPMGWEAQLVIIEGPKGGFYVWAEDERGRFKRLVVERNADGWQLTLATINHAPFDKLTACESVPWHLDVYEGDWRVPARRYRDWMAARFQPVPIERQQPGWIKDIRAMVILGLNRELLEPLAERLDPAQTILYVPDWRQAGYDRDYPVYDQPRDGLAPFVEAAHKLGFRVMLHVNYFGVDPLNPLYRQFEPYQVRDPWGEHEKLWWLWERAEPEIRFAYINPAHKPWRDYFVRAMAELCRRYRIDSVHLDQTLCLFNDHNGLIDGMSMVDGNVALHRELRQALPEVALSGEGLNEITCRYEAFAQRHAWGVNHADGTWNRRELAAAHPISSYLLRPYTIINGYLGCAPPTQGQLYAAWNDAYEHWGVMPTLKPNLQELRRPTGFSRQFFDEASFWLGNRLEIDPEADWPADVAFPFRTRDGRRAVRTVDGRLVFGDKLISRTITGVGEAEGRGTIPDWRAYDDKRLMGLDPEQWYPYFDQPRDLQAFHAASLPEDMICEGVVAKDRLAVIRTRSRAAIVFDLADQIDRAVCGSKPFDQPAREWKGPGTADDGGQFTDAGSGLLAAHPPWKSSGSGTAYARYQVDLPPEGRLALTSGVALAERATEAGRSDGVTFRISATDGRKRIQQELHHASETPHAIELDLTPLAGKTVTVELAVEPGPKRSPSFDWARWHQPRIERRGRREAKIGFAGGHGYTLAIDPQGQRPIEQHGGIQTVTALLPGSIFLLREPPPAAQLPLDLAGQPPIVMFLDDSGRELLHAEHAAIHPVQLSAGGTARVGFFAHPPNHGQTLAHFPMVLPAEPARFTCQVGLRERSQSDGVIFVVEVNGQEVARQRMVPGPWQPLSADLSPWAGRPIVLSLITDSDGPFSFDWACWGEPSLQPVYNGK